MPFTITVALDISDTEVYAQYRAAMRPLLEQEGGRFTYDFSIAETLKSRDGQHYNRIFLLEFPDLENHDRFFANPEYKAIRNRLFNASVRSFAILSTA